MVLMEFNQPTIVDFNGNGNMMKYVFEMFLYGFFVQDHHTGWLANIASMSVYGV